MIRIMRRLREQAQTMLCIDSEDWYKDVRFLQTILMSLSSLHINSLSMYNPIINPHKLVKSSSFTSKATS